MNPSRIVYVPGPISSKLERRRQARLHRLLLEALVDAVGRDRTENYRVQTIARCFLLARDPSKVAQAEQVLQAALEADRAAERHSDAAKDSDRADGTFDALVQQLPQLPDGGRIR